jgi:hypothetical protein
VVGASRVFAADSLCLVLKSRIFRGSLTSTMMLVVTGRERTTAELAELLAAAGWRYDAWGPGAERLP